MTPKISFFAKRSAKQSELKLFFGLCVLSVCLASPQLALAETATPRAARGACTLPICDLEGELARLQSQGSNGRNQTLEGFRAMIPTLTDPAAIEVIALFGSRAAQLLTDLQEEGWVIRTAQSVASVALRTLLLTPGVPTADLLRYFTQLDDSETRYRTLSTWSTNLAAIEAPSLALLRDYHRLFEHAVQVSGSNDAYVMSMARGGLSTIAAKILLNHIGELETREALTFFTAISDSQLKRDIPNTFATQVEQSSIPLNDTLLIHMRDVSLQLQSLYQNEPEWVQSAVRSWQSEVSQKLFFSASTTAATQITYFTDLSTSKRYSLILRFETELNQKIVRAEIDRGINTLKAMLEVLRDNERGGEYEGSDAYIERQLRGSLSTTSIRLIQNFRLNEVEIRQAVSQISGESSLGLLATTFNQVLTPLAPQDPYLDTLFTALGQVILDLTERMRGQPDKQWIIAAINDPLASAALKLLDRTTLSAGQIVLYASGVRNSDRRRGLVDTLKRRAMLPANGVTDVTLYHSVFDSLIELFASQGDPEWVVREAMIAREAIAKRLLIEWETTGELAKHLIQDITSLEPRRILFVELGNKASEWNGATPAATQTYLEALYEVLEFAVQDSRSERFSANRWIADAAQAVWDQASVRLLRNPIVNAQSMIRYFRNMQSDQRRSEILTYWRNKSSRGYDDRNSILELAAFFYRASTIIEQTGGADWLASNARGGEQELSEKASIMFPIYEGSYQVTSSELPNLGHVQIMNTIGGDGLIVEFTGRTSGRNLFQFVHTNVTRGLTRIDATTNQGGLLSRLIIDLNPFTGAVSGTIQNSGRSGLIRFAGTQTRSAANLYENQTHYLAGVSNPRAAVPASNQIDGAYTGTVGQRRVRFTLSTIGVQGPRVEPILYLTAALRFEGQTTAPLLFGNGRYNPRTGILLLTAILPNNSRVKLTVGARKIGNRVQLVGATHNSAGDAETLVDLTR